MWECGVTALLRSAFRWQCRFLYSIRFLACGVIAWQMWRRTQPWPAHASLSSRELEAAVSPTTLRSPVNSPSRQSRSRISSSPGRSASGDLEGASDDGAKSGARACAAAAETERKMRIARPEVQEEGDRECPAGNNYLINVPAILYPICCTPAVLSLLLQDAWPCILTWLCAPCLRQLTTPVSLPRYAGMKTTACVPRHQMRF